MARKDTVQNFLSFGASGCDMSASQTSTISSVQFMDNIGILLSWSGASAPVGVFTVEVSNDYNPVVTNAGTWMSLDFGSSIAISGSSGSHEISINQLPYSWIREKYTRTSGSGTLNVFLSAKQGGG